MIRIAGQSGSYKFHQEMLYNIPDVDRINSDSPFVITHNKGIWTQEVRVFRLYDDGVEVPVHTLYYAGGHLGYFVRNATINSISIEIAFTNVARGQTDWDYRIELWT